MGKGAGKGKGKKKGKKDKVAVIPGGLTAEEEKDRQSKAKKAFEYFKETKVEEKKFDTYRQEREQLNYFWIVEKKRLEDKKAEQVRSPRPTMFSRHRREGLFDRNARRAGGRGSGSRGEARRRGQGLQATRQTPTV